MALAAFWAGGIWLGALLLAAAGIMAVEWIGICLGQNLDNGAWSPSPNPKAVALLASVLLAAMAAAFGLLCPALVIAVIGTVLVLALTGARRGLDDVILSFGVVYVVIPIVAVMVLIGDNDYGLRSVFWVLAIVWATDSGAYAAGRLIGGDKLAPTISPSKTWSGLAGGVFAAVAVAIGMAALDLVASTPRLVGLSVVLCLVAQGGDLLESALKRRFDVKDSGTIIPGHGGALDRLDGLLAAFPAVACGYLVAGSGAFIWR